MADFSTIECRRRPTTNGQWKINVLGKTPTKESHLHKSTDCSKINTIRSNFRDRPTLVSTFRKHVGLNFNLNSNSNPKNFQLSTNFANGKPESGLFVQYAGRINKTNAGVFGFAQTCNAYLSKT